MSREAAGPDVPPTIASVLARFRSEERARASKRVFRDTESILELLEMFLDDYGETDLEPAERQRFDAASAASPGKPPRFCDHFGPERIVAGYGEFLGYFMVRKVAASKTDLRAAGKVTRMLAAWLAERGYVPPAEAAEAAGRAAEAQRDLPATDDILEMLNADGETVAWDPAGEELDDHFHVRRVADRKLWVEGSDGRPLGPISVPAGVSRLVRPGWEIAGVIGRAGRSWRFIEAWTVYPG